MFKTVKFDASAQAEPDDTSFLNISSHFEIPGKLIIKPDIRIKNIDINNVDYILITNRKGDDFASCYFNKETLKKLQKNKNEIILFDDFSAGKLRFPDLKQVLERKEESKFYEVKEGKISKKLTVFLMNEINKIINQKGGDVTLLLKSLIWKNKLKTYSI